MIRQIFCLLCLLPVWIASAAETPPTLHHQLKVQLSPDQGHLKVQDRLTLTEPVDQLTLLLHGDLKAEISEPGAKISSKSVRSWVPLKQYSIRFSQPTQTFTLEYQGRISHDLSRLSKDYAGGRDTTPGLISSQGVFLSAGSFWYPQIEDHLLSFTLDVSLPNGWSSVSQGNETATNRWQETLPQDDIYLIAAPFRVYNRETPVAKAQVFLREKDDALADRYLNATADYLQLYEKLLGSYPYAKFALVENFWESGYGMPSFTLLGPQVIRLPFIIHTSYPHEILHNWWGNSVFIDYSSGNWAEGLTSYLADHLLKEQQGSGEDYRRNSLQKYADYVAESEDFPLTEFRSHHGDVSQAVGYSKTLMFFHMLRKKLGDSTFLEGLRRFYQDNLYRSASFADLRTAFENSSRSDLRIFFDQWTTRTGAPALSVADISVQPTDEGYRLRGVVEQTQTQAAYALEIPLFIQLENTTEPLAFNLGMTGKRQTFDYTLKQRPVKISIDPRFELFRKLHPQELPASLGQLFGTERLSIVLPFDATAEMKTAYRQLAEAWQQRGANIDIHWDNRLKQLPDHPTWLFGRENSFMSALKQATGQQGIDLTIDSVDWQGVDYSLNHNSLALALKTDPQDSTITLGFLTSPTPAALKTLARKLPHYGRYSYTLFEGDAVNNRLKGQWSLSESPLSVKLVETTIPAVSIPSLQPLTAVIE